jgi:hypothetical protein
VTFEQTIHQRKSAKTPQNASKNKAVIRQTAKMGTFNKIFHPASIRPMPSIPNHETRALQNVNQLLVG